MKINPYSSSYTSSSSNTGKTNAASGNIRDAAARRRQPGSAENHFHVQRQSIDKSSSASSNSALRRPALEDQSVGATGYTLNYYTGVENSKQVPDRHGFYVSPIDQVAARDNDFADFKRVNNRVNERALASYREHQAMDEEQAQRQQHQWILGVDTYA